MKVGVDIPTMSSTKKNTTSMTKRVMILEVRFMVEVFIG